MENLITIMNKTANGSSGSAASTLAEGESSGSSSNVRSQKESYKATKKIASKGWMKSLGKTIGVTMSVSAVLKQSQVFTSMFGVLFQIVGAMADIMLAPVVKYLAPKIGELANMAIANARKMGTKIEAVLGWLFSDGSPTIKLLQGILKFSDLLTRQVPIRQVVKLFEIIDWIRVGGYMDHFTAMMGKWWRKIKSFFETLIDAIKEKLNPKNIAKELPGANTLGGLFNIGKKVVDVFKGSTSVAEAATVRSRLNITRTNLPLPTGAHGEGAMGEMLNERMTMEGFGVSKGQSAHINQMIMGDQQLREHAKTDHDTMMAARQNSPRGFGGAGHADM